MATTSAKDTANDFDAGFQTPPPAGAFKYGKVGDEIKGVFLGKEPFQGDYQPTFTYKIKAIAGHFHNSEGGVVDSVPTSITPGVIYNVFEKNTFANEIAQAKIGQQVIIRYFEDGVTKKTGKPFKNIICKLGGMDPDYIKENGGVEELDF